MQEAKPMQAKAESSSKSGPSSSSLDASFDSPFDRLFDSSFDCSFDWIARHGRRRGLVVVLFGWRLAVVNLEAPVLEIGVAKESVLVQRRRVEDRFGGKCLCARVEVADSVQSIAHGDVVDV